MPPQPPTHTTIRPCHRTPSDPRDALRPSSPAASAQRPPQVQVRSQTDERSELDLDRGRCLCATNRLSVARCCLRASSIALTAPPFFNGRNPTHSTSSPPMLDLHRTVVGGCTFRLYPVIRAGSRRGSHPLGGGPLRPGQVGDHRSPGTPARVQHHHVPRTSADSIGARLHPSNYSAEILVDDLRFCPSTSAAPAVKPGQVVVDAACGLCTGGYPTTLARSLHRYTYTTRVPPVHTSGTCVPPVHGLRHLRRNGHVG